MKFAGDTKAEWVRVTITDADGTVLFGTRQPVEASDLSEAARVEPAASDSAAAFAKNEAQARGLDVKSFEMVSLGPDNVVAMAMVVDPVEKRDAELSSIVWELLPAVREHVEKEQQIPVSLYRLSIQSADGQPLVEYVVDTAERSVRAWMAEGVKPVWARGVAEPRTSD